VLHETVAQGGQAPNEQRESAAHYGNAKIRHDPTSLRVNQSNRTEAQVKKESILAERISRMHKDYSAAKR
jgi:hypothetical protein